MDPDDPLRSLFYTVASAGVARAAAAAAAAIQVEHYNQLIAEGMSEERALELTALTSKMLFESVGILIDTLAKNQGQIMDAVERVLNMTPGGPQV